MSSLGRQSAEGRGDGGQSGGKGEQIEYFYALSAEYDININWWRWGGSVKLISCMFVINIGCCVFHYENNYLTTHVAVYGSLNYLSISVVVNNTQRQRVFSFEDKYYHDRRFS